MASAVLMPYDNHSDIPELLVISSSADINGSLFTDAIVQKNCSVRVWGSVSGSLTIEIFDLLRYRRHDHAATLCAFDIIELDGADGQRASKSLCCFSMGRSG